LNRTSFVSAYQYDGQIQFIYQYLFQPSNNWSTINLPLEEYIQTNLSSYVSGYQVSLKNSISENASILEKGEILGTGILVTNKSGPFRLEIKEIQSVCNKKKKKV